MFQFPGFASQTYVFSLRYTLRCGFPHSDISGSKPTRSSPELIAACHVLHRLSVPRHPPDALVILDPYQKPDVLQSFTFYKGHIWVRRADILASSHLRNDCALFRKELKPACVTSDIVLPYVSRNFANSNDKATVKQNAFVLIARYCHHNSQRQSLHFLFTISKNNRGNP